ncbi:response regulator transcription factor [Sporolactobacillus shoreicorticis]|uniref:Response regulator transcription factor n=1 Tax=Sporolactobacillus shoreicorticis TaxID=1923877 RepID=A0ABW5S2G4_9BACL|nr:response regulator transcription factor [Sporolactobacillus shoreicorticis]MCO7127069.1 response regulator transcription factor [Sporolactobacillus shoreicorticis]
MNQALKSSNEVTTRDNAIGIDPNQLGLYDLIILDVMMPEKDGFDFLRENRYYIDAPVLFLTARDFEEDKLEGFASGADDYITKPFSIKELRARVDAHMRREKRKKHSRLSDGPVACDLIQKKFFANQMPIQLTPSEYELCVFLLRNSKQVFSKKDIYTSVYGYDAVGDSQTTITERIKQIRNKFQKANINPIQTVWGVGYKWDINGRRIIDHGTV